MASESTSMSKQLEITRASIEALRCREETYDVLLVCKPEKNLTSSVAEEEKLGAHRVILRAGSSYFDTMFSATETKEASSEICLPTIRQQTMHLVLDFIYLKQTNIKILSDEETLNLFSAANLLEIKPLVDICVEELPAKLKLENCAKILKLAMKYSIQRLITSVVQYSVAHDLTENEEVLDLDFECFSSLINTSTNQNCRSANDLVKLIYNWVLRNTVDRNKYLVTLLTPINFAFVSKNLIDGLINEDKLFNDNATVYKFLLKKIFNAFVTNSPDSDIATSNPKLLIFRSHAVHSFDLEKKQWSVNNLFPTLSPTPSSKIVVTNRAVYFTTDTEDKHADGDESSMRIVVYYPHLNCGNFVTTCGRINCFAMAHIDDRLYLIGEHCDRSKKCMKSFDVTSKTWQNHTLLDKLVIDPVVATFNGNLYVSRNALFFEQVLSKYSPLTDQWESLNFSYSPIQLFDGRMSVMVPYCSKLYAQVAHKQVNAAFLSSVLIEYDLDTNSCREIMRKFETGVENPYSWVLCGNTKQCLVIAQGNKYYGLNPETLNKYLITQQVEVNGEDPGVVVLFS